MRSQNSQSSPSFGSSVPSAPKEDAAIFGTLTENRRTGRPERFRRFWFPPRIMRRLTRFFLPSISEIVFLSVFLLLALQRGQALLRDGDTGYHIRAGEFIIQNWIIPQRDIFSFRNPPIPWTVHEWLSEIFMALVHRASGLTG